MGCHRYVFRRFHTTLDLKRPDARVHKRICVGKGKEVFHRKEIALFARLVRIAHPARLGALPAIAATPAEHAAEKTQPRIRVAQRAVNKNLYFQGRILGNVPDFLQRQLPRKHDAFKPHLLQLFNPCKVVYSHLCAGVQAKWEWPGLYKTQDTHILNNQGVRL